MIEKFMEILEDQAEGKNTREIAKILLDNDIYISKYKFGQKVFGAKISGEEREAFQGTICGISYYQTQGPGTIPEIWYSVKIEGKDDIEILEEKQIRG